MLENIKKDLMGKAWTRRNEMEDEIESLDYEIISNGIEMITVIDLHDDDEAEIHLWIKIANGIIWIADIF